MVQTDISQLSKECNQWREHLHFLRDEFNQLKMQLQHIANKPLSKDQLTALEHFQNQLHIQLINIHDLKQAVKMHDRNMQQKFTDANGKLAEDSFVDHERLYDDYEYLRNNLEELRSEFNKFKGGILN